MFLELCVACVITEYWS